MSLMMSFIWCRSYLGMMSLDETTWHIPIHVTGRRWLFILATYEASLTSTTWISQPSQHSIFASNNATGQLYVAGGRFPPACQPHSSDDGKLDIFVRLKASCSCFLIFGCRDTILTFVKGPQSISGRTKLHSLLSHCCQSIFEYRQWLHCRQHAFLHQHDNHKPSRCHSRWPISLHCGMEWQCIRCTHCPSTSFLAWTALSWLGIVKVQPASSMDYALCWLSFARGHIL